MNNKKIRKLKIYSNNKTLENIRSYKRKKTVRRRLTGIFIGGLSLVIIATIPIIKNIQQADKFDQNAVQLSKELKTTENEQKMLEYKVALLEDEEYIAKLARKELNLSKGNEILINLPEDEKELELEEENSVKTNEKEE